MTPEHPLRFGVGADPFGAEDFARWRDLAARAETLGYSSLLIGDHFTNFLPAGGAAPFLALAGAAAVTTTLQLGTVVLGNDYRHPAVTAKDAATLDLLSDGRLELGIGAGWYAPEYKALGLPFDPPGERIDRLDEAIEILKRSWAGEAFDFAGEYYTITGYAGTPLPVRPGGPRLLVGGGSAKVLRLGGRVADIVGIHPSTAATNAVENTSFEATRRKIDWVREGAGDRFSKIELQMSCSITVTDGSPASFAALAETHGASVGDFRESAMFVVGDTDQIADELLRRRDLLGITYFIVPSTAVEQLAPVVARFAGS